MTRIAFASFTIVEGQFKKARVIRNGRPVEIELHNKEEYRQLLALLYAGS